MARAFWKGSLSFGLVEIPVSLKPAVRSQDLSFTLLDREDFAPIGNKRYNKNTGKEVPWNRTIRGYEYEPDEYVVLSDEELKRANVEATQTIDLVEFVDAQDIDTVYFDTPYYVEPQKKASKSYALLRATLERTGKAGIARVVLRTRQHVCALVVRGSALVLNLLHYAHEIVPASELEVPPGKQTGVSEAEIKMAEKLVEGMSGAWKPAEFKDDYHDDVLALVEKKVKSGQTHTVVEPKEEEAAPRRRTEVVDLMSLLKESLENQERKPASRARPRAKRATAERKHRKSA